jgi:cell division septation protein DedD
VNTRYLEDEELDSAAHEREISLGATTLLGIFLLLALVCAVFFGFGYSMGRRSSLATNAAPDSVQAASLKGTGATKPAPGLTPAATASHDSDESASDDATAPQLPQPSQEASAELSRPTEQQKPLPATVAADKPTNSSSSSQFAPPAISKAAPVPAVALHPVATIAPAGPPALVQVAAVSHQEDADMLLNALKRRGYDVAIRHEPQDKLLHIQLGPFASRKDADEMRKRLLSDGYNAIVK